MNEKITMPELADQLMQKTACTRKDAESFLRECFALAAEIVSKGEILKIAGLGTFEPVWVESRLSINVQTGLPFEIPGHYKLSFSPEKSMRDAVNAPFACFETEILDDDTELASEINTEDTEEDIAYDDEPEEEVTPVILSPESDTPDDPEAGQPVAGTLKSALPVTGTENPVIEEKPVAIKAPLTIQSEKTAATSGHFAVVLTLVCGFLILILIASYMLFRPLKKDAGRQQTDNTQLERPLQKSMVQPIDSLAGKAAGAEPPGDTITVKAAAPVIEVVKPGVFMTRLALKHYGHKAFWVYIYEENRHKIKNPDNVQTGTHLVIPDKAKYGIDNNDTASVKQAVERANAILSAFK